MLSIRSLTKSTVCRLSLGLMGLLLVGCSGCSPDSSPDSSREFTATGETAVELLEKMRDAYRQAKSYTDNADYLQQSVLRSEGVERETLLHHMTLAFQRPNKLRLQFEQAVASPSGSSKFDIAINGVQVRSHVSTLPEQVHEAEAPPSLTPDNMIPSPEIRAALFEVSLENIFPQLRMLLATDSEQTIFSREGEPKLIKKAKLGDANCYRVSLHSPEGTRVLWIDDQSYALRRMELPVDSQKSMIDPHNVYSKLAIRIDFRDVSFDAEIAPQTFELEIPEGGRRVRKLVFPPSEAPSPDLGQTVADLLFTTLDGEEITSETFSGKVVVLDFWYTGCPPCKSQTPVLDKVYQQYKDSQEVLFYAVSTDRPSVSNEVVAKTLAAWGGNMPVLRDLADSGYDKLNVRVTPTLVLIGRDGSLQQLQIGMHLDPEPLARSIQELVDGKDLAAIAIAEYKKQVEKFQQALDEVTIRETPAKVQDPEK